VITPVAPKPADPRALFKNLLKEEIKQEEKKTGAKVLPAPAVVPPSSSPAGPKPAATPAAGPKPTGPARTAPATKPAPTPARPVNVAAESEPRPVFKNILEKEIWEEQQRQKEFSKERNITKKCTDSDFSLTNFTATNFSEPKFLLMFFFFRPLIFFSASSSSSSSEEEKLVFKNLLEKEIWEEEQRRRQFQNERAASTAHPGVPGKPVPASHKKASSSSSSAEEKPVFKNILEKEIWEAKKHQEKFDKERAAVPSGLLHSQKKASSSSSSSSAEEKPVFKNLLEKEIWEEKQRQEKFERERASTPHASGSGKPAPASRKKASSSSSSSAEEKPVFKNILEKEIWEAKKHQEKFEKERAASIKVPAGVPKPVAHVAPPKEEKKVPVFKNLLEKEIWEEEQRRIQFARERGSSPNLHSGKKSSSSSSSSEDGTPMFKNFLEKEVWEEKQRQLKFQEERNKVGLAGSSSGNLVEHVAKPESAPAPAPVKEVRPSFHHPPVTHKVCKIF
jgi:hypothetical protein